MAHKSAMQQLQLDPPVQLVATYRMDLADRRYLDEQIRFTQEAVYRTALVGYSAHWSWVDPAAGAVVKGDALCVSATGDNETAYLRRADTAALIDAGTVAGIALTDAAPGGRVLVATAGHLPRSVTGLALLGYVAYVRVTAAGRLEQTTTPTGEMIVGRSAPNGRMTVVLGSEASGGSLASANDWKESARFCVTSALPAHTRTGNTIDANANGAFPTVDGVTAQVGDRFVHAVGTDLENGIWAIVSLGSGGSKWSATRTSDADGSGDVTAGMRVGVTEGTNNKGVWQLITADPITLNTTPLTFQKDQALPAGVAVGQTVVWNGSSWTAGALDLASAAAVSGVLGLANGGTGLSATPAVNTVLTGTGAAAAWSASPTVTSVIATSHLATGANPAGSGALRLSHASGVYGQSSTPGTARSVVSWGVVANDTTAVGNGATATQIDGSVVEINGSTATMLEATEVAAGRRVVSLALGADLTTVEMPANTGDRVLYVANAATLPTTGDPSGGLIVYGTSGALGLHAAGIAFHQRVTAAGITHTAQPSDALPTDLVFTPQAPFATATGANRKGGDFTVVLSAPTNGGTAEGRLAIKRGASRIAAIGPLDTSPTVSCLWLTGSTPTTTNYTFAANGTNCLLNAESAAGIVYFLAGNASMAALYYNGLFEWNTTAAVPQIYQAARASDAAAIDFKIQAQSAWASASTNKDGAHLLLRGGAEKGSAAGKKGGVRLQLNATTETMIEATEVAIGRRVVALCRGSDVTTTQLPSGTGDRVAYVADCATEPTASPVSGLLLYSASSRLMVHAVGLAFHDLAGAISIGIKQAVSDVGTSTIGLFGQDAYASATGTNRNGGNVIIQGGTKATGGNAGGVQIKDGDAQKVYEVGANAHGFFGTAPTTKQTVTGAKGGNAALASLLTALANYGFVTDSST